MGLSPGVAIIVIVAQHYMRPETTARMRDLLAPESPEEAIEFWPVSRTASWLMLPYLTWVTCAAALNAAIWRMNI